MAPFATMTSAVAETVSEGSLPDNWSKKPTKAEQEAKRKACLEAAKNDLKAPRREYIFRWVGLRARGRGDEDGEWSSCRSFMWLTPRTFCFLPPTPDVF